MPSQPSSRAPTAAAISSCRNSGLKTGTFPDFISASFGTLRPDHAPCAGVVVGISPVFGAKGGRLQRPAYRKNRVVPAHPARGVRDEDGRNLVKNFGRIRQRLKAVGAAFRDVKHALVFRR